MIRRGRCHLQSCRRSRRARVSVACVELRELQVEGVNLFVADVANEEGRAVRRNAGPRTKWAVVATDVADFHDCLQAQVGEAKAIEGGLLHQERIEEDTFSVVRPFHIANGPKAPGNDCPLSGSKFVEEKIIVVRVRSQEVAAIGRPTRTTDAIRAGESGSASRGQIKQLN